MNKDSKLIFEAYRLVSELDIGTDWAGGASEPIRKKMLARQKDEGKDVYLIGAIAKGLNISTDKAADIFTAALFPHLFKQIPGLINGKEVGYTNPAKNESIFRNDIVKAIGRAIVEIQKEYPKLQIPSAKAQRDYTARLISNMGEFYKDYEQGEAGVAAPVGGVVAVKKAVKSADPTAEAKPSAPVAASANDVYIVNSMAKFIPEFQRVFAEMPDQFVVGKGEDLFSSKQFKSAVDDAITQAVKSPEDQSSLRRDMQDVIDSFKFKKAFIPQAEKPAIPGADSGEIETLPGAGGHSKEDYVEILRDLGTYDTAKGFDDYDKHSSY